MKINIFFLFVLIFLLGCKKQDIIETPLSDDDSVYVGDLNNLYSLDASTGKKNWSFESFLYYSSPIYNNGTVYCRGITGIPFYGVDAKTGLKKRQPLGWDSHTRSSPIIYNDYLFQLNNYGNILYALNLNNGFKPWEFKSNEGRGSNNSTSPVIKNGVIYIIMNYKLYAIDPQTGIAKWVYPLLYGYTSYSTPLVADGLVYVTSLDLLYAIDITNGESRWTLPFTGGLNGASSPIINNDILYINAKGYLYSIDVKTGTVIWKSSFYVSDSYQTPFYKDGFLYTSFGDAIYSIDSKTASIKWSLKLKGGIAASPTVSNGMVYIGTQGGTFYAIDAINGKIKWEFSSGVGFESSAFILTKKGEVIYSNICNSNY